MTDPIPTPEPQTQAGRDLLAMLVDMGAGRSEARSHILAIEDGYEDLPRIGCNVCEAEASRPEQDEAVRLLRLDDVSALLDFAAWYDDAWIRSLGNLTPEGVDGARWLVTWLQSKIAALDWLATPPPAAPLDYEPFRAWHGECACNDGRCRCPCHLPTDSEIRAVAATPPALPLSAERLVDILDEAEGDGIIGPNYTPPRLAEYILARLSPEQEATDD